MHLTQLTTELQAPLHGSDGEITGISYDSRRVKPGDLFCCNTGASFDGHNFAGTALQKGAAALLCERLLPLDMPQIVVPNARLAMAHAAAAFYGHPERELRLLGVTGTNGKTSTTYMVKAIAEAAGVKAALMGTIQNLIGDEVIPTVHTTPESADTFALLRRMADAGCRFCVMEVSSHALEQGRVHALPFAAGLFTNLTQDHLDYHGNFEAYYQAKRKLFDQCEMAIINIDDPYGLRMARGLPCPTLHLGIREKDTDIYASNIEITNAGSAFHLQLPGVGAHINLRISGLFSVYNALGAAALAQLAGIPFPAIVRGLESLTVVPGRLEAVDEGQPFSVYVDYAHTPDALINVLNTCRGFAKKRVFSLFGCGGDRDPKKRPLMGEAAGRLSDYVVITSDNPRSEDPDSIIREAEIGVKKTGTPYLVRENRREAIHLALSMLEKDDILVIAGKGHEDYQEIRGVKYHFDDREVVREWLRAN
ncbi:MAG: UDP-N-acetylmuramoyl-L-alanyl-D-glutamate--2,6-diaminopimelate ligase [Clostridiales bacterium]|nr:UDP-N-acetylmuramoyl-L-alanyl-D-glutamate--2,6-diaminopimelate ligase [Clostridiales bacterium]